MKSDLLQAAKEHRIITAHRGVSAGNIPCNTIPAFETALKQGADMLEADLSLTADGKLVIFHPKMEPIHLNSNLQIPNLTLDEVKKLRYYNYDNAETQFGVETFDNFLEQFKNRCYINIDKFWGAPEEIYEAVKRHDMQDQILVKSKLSKGVLSVLEQIAPDLAFMPIAAEEHPQHAELMRKNINYVGVEILFSSEQSAVAAPSFTKQMHSDGKLVWVNSIIYDHKEQLTAGHSDDSALCDSMEYGWGWLADRDFDIIQTDWPSLLVEFLKSTNRYYRK